MHRRLVITVPFLSAGALGCGGLDRAPAESLRERFPEQAALVLERGEALVTTAEGFALPAAERARGSVAVAWPRDGREPIRLRGLDGVEVRVRELGAEGKGALVERAVAFPRAGGTSYWTATAGGVEEWLHLEAHAVRSAQPAVIWEVEGGRVRPRGEGVEIVDPGGVVRLSVTAPVAYGAGGRRVGVRLAGSGARIELWADADGEAVLIDPLWVAAGSLNDARANHRATLLGDGKVLVTGGQGFSGYLTSAELYDPGTNAWSPTGSLVVARNHLHTATLLGDGRVLVAGGYYGTAAELYDPTAGTWSMAASLSAVPGSAAVRLQNGKVLVSGGGANNSGAELYDPATNTWSAAAGLIQGRTGHTATLLGNGKVLVAGGQGNPGYYPTSAELYNPATNTWSAAGSMSEGRSLHTATLLANGKVLVAGGGTQTSAASVDLYDPAANTWSATAAMIQPRNGHSATRLPSGEVLVAGGTYTSQSPNAELYNPTTGQWSPAPTMTQPSVYAHTATLLGSGVVLIAGGAPVGGPIQPRTTCERYVTPAGPLGSACGSALDCLSGYCADGVCCDGPCAAGACDACSVAAGAPTDGTCALLTGTPCDDGNGNTVNDVCTAGLCKGVDHCAGKTCTPADECHAPGTCFDHATGACTKPTKPDGTACTGGLCQAGICTPQPDAGTDGGSGGAGGAGGATGTSGTTTATGGTGGATGTSGTTTATGGTGGTSGSTGSSGTSGTTTATGGTGGSTGTSGTTTATGIGGDGTGEPTRDLSCQLSAVPASSSPWRVPALLTLALLAALRRRAARRSGLLAAGHVVAVAALLAPAPAHADTPSAKQVCADAYLGTQTLRDQGKLVDARKQAVTCAASSCSTHVTRDCTRWLAEIDAALPTVVLAATDPAGNDTFAVRVTIDGRLVADPLDGKAIALDPGQHLVRFEMAGADPVEQEVLIRQAEKNRRIDASFKKPPPAPSPPAPPPPAALPAPVPPVPAPLPPSPPGSVPTWTWLAGGAGLVALGVAAGFGVSALKANGAITEECGGDAGRCPGDAATRAATDPLVDQRRIGRDVFIGLGVVGIAGITAAAVGMVAGKRSPRTSWGLTPTAGPSGVGLGLLKRF